jgi:cytochrome b subunit of formate dehydrogenase
LLLLLALAVGPATTSAQEADLPTALPAGVPGATQEAAVPPQDADASGAAAAAADETELDEPEMTEPEAEEAEADETEVDETEADDVIPPDLEDNQCVLCHGTEEIWDAETRHLFVRVADLVGDVHWQRGIRCQGCHGGNAETTDLRTAHAVEDGFRKIDQPIDEVAFCGHCHGDADYLKSVGSDSPATVITEFLASAHGQHLQRVGDQRSTTCSTCHGKHHAMRGVDDMQATVFVHNQVALCGACHEQAWSEYRVSVHGQGLERSGLIKTAVCANCHGAHAILNAADPASRLHVSRVADTCGACHRFIEERLKRSVHGTGNGPGGMASRAAPGGTKLLKPSCTDCHMGHDLPDPRSAGFRNREPDRCGICHADLYARYGMSMHGALTNLGYAEGAKCSDCHGDHDILPLADPASPMAAGNRQATCARCHAGMSAKLASFDPHADHHDAQRSPLVFWVYRGVLTFIIVVFGFFGLHAVCWFLRGLVDVLRHGRPTVLVPQQPAYLRFRPFHRVAHTVLVVSFLGLALTGLPLKFSDQAWAQWLAALLGGFSSTGLWHRVFGVAMFGCFLAYLGLFARLYQAGRRAGRPRREILFGPDSPLPNYRDAQDLAAMVRWFIGRGPRPTFERWAYWEKFDFFGATSDTILIGLSGLILWFPNWFCLFLPGEAVNVAKVVHSTLALLATGFVFAIHFFGTHFRADKFPMDVSILTGVVSEEELRHERPELLARWQATGELDALRTQAPSRGRLRSVRLAGTLALITGLAALAGIILSLLQ